MAENKIESLDDRRERAWRMLEMSGITLGNRMFIQSTFAEAGRQSHPEISKHDVRDSNPYHTNDKVKGWGFGGEEEAIFIGALKDYAPDADDQRIITILEIVNKLLDVDSEYKFRKNRK